MIESKLEHMARQKMPRVKTLARLSREARAAKRNGEYKERVRAVKKEVEEEEEALKESTQQELCEQEDWSLVEDEVKDVCDVPSCMVRTKSVKIETPTPPNSPATEPMDVCSLKLVEEKKPKKKRKKRDGPKRVILPGENPWLDFLKKYNQMNSRSAQFLETPLGVRTRMASVEYKKLKAEGKIPAPVKRATPVAPAMAESDSCSVL